MFLARRLRLSIAAAASVIALAGGARASLTSSEQAQLRQYVAAGRIETAGRARALVARTDLSAEESTQALKDAFGPAPFDDAHAAFAREMLFGDASIASRPLLAVAMTRALVAHADAILSRYAADLDANPRAADELWRVYRSLDELAGGGPRRAEASAPAPATEIPPASYEECARALAEHLERHPRWLGAGAQIGLPAVRVRGQLALAIVDTMSHARARPADVAARLGLTGARRKLFVETGALVVDSGKADDARVDKMRQILDRLPAVRAGAAALVFGDENPRLSARGAVIALKAPLEASGAGSGTPFDEEVEPGSFDAAMLDLTRDLATVAARRALEARPQLRALAERDLAAAREARFGRPADATPEAGLAAAMQLLLTDAPRAIDLAFVRFLSHDAASASILSDALGVLAASAMREAPAIALGKARADGTTETVQATSLRVASNGAATAFTLDGHTWTLARDAGPVLAVQRDGLPLVITMLAAARVPARDAASWSTPGLVLAKMSGSPRAGVAPGPRIRLVGAGERGYDTIATLAPGRDVVVEMDLNVQNELAGVALRAAATKGGFRGAALMLTPGASPRIALVLREDDGFESFLAAPLDVPELGVVHVRLAVKGTKVEAKVGDHVLRGTIPASIAQGEIAFFARKGATLEAAGFRVRAQ